MELERDGNARIDSVYEMLSSTSLNGVEAQSKIQKREKDPRKISRKYQTELCKKALEENVIVYLETGCGKTHIAVLLIYEMRHLIKKPQKKICIFLAPTVALVQQQAKVIEASIDLKVGTYFGSSSRLRFHRDWEKEIEENEVLVMTPKILLDNLSHCFIKLELIALLIFDECHYAQLESNHPYAEIMKIFYNVNLPQLPRIFGMTASPILGKGGSIDGLERLMRAKVYSVEDRNELEEFVTSPKMNIYYYGSTKDIYSSSLMILNDLKTQCITALQMKKLDQSIIRSTKKLLQRLHSNIIFCLESLGLLGAKVASYTFLRSGQYESNEVLEVDNGSTAEMNLCHQYLHNAGSVLSSACKGDGGMEPDLSAVEVLKEPYFSRKILRLIGILSSYRLQSSTKCIVFVNRIVTAKSLSHILRNIKFLSHWKCGFLVGVSSGLVSRKDTDVILERFRSGELNLLIATKVGEEGLDIQTCCLVIRFDLPETVASFIQSRGRARMPQSEYAFLVDRSNPEEVNLIEAFRKEEAQMNEEISMRKNCFAETNFEEKTYKVDSTGATISSVSSISLLHRYCSKLPHDEYFKPKPEFFYLDDADGTVCNIILPTNAPIRNIVGEAQSSIEAAKRDACLKACKSLHEVGGLTDYLLPEQDDKYEELTLDKSITNTINDEESRAELHEMLVPSVLKAKWRESEGSTCFSCYFIKFCPDPADRVYRSFGLFIKESLPEEVVKMNLDLFLDRGRKVMTQLVPCGVTSFDKEEIDKAEKFQNMFLKAVLDRHELTSEFVSLETCDLCKSNSLTFYLLLPVIPVDYNKILVDWTLMQRSLSSTIFRHPSIHVNDESSQLRAQLHLASGQTSAHDVVNSLVYIPFKNKFYFIADILTEKSGFSLYDDSKSHVEHYVDTFGINLVHPDQPLLKAKQLFILSNFLRKRMQGKWREKEEHFIEIPPEICQLKVIGFSKDIGSSLSVLPSVMHRLENFLVALELKERLTASFPEAAEVTLSRILEALTTEACGENFSLERLEVLGDSFLKFAVGRHLFLKHDTLDEGQLSSRRSNIVNNANLHALAIRNNLQGYIRDQALDADHFFPFGRSCPISCAKQTEKSIHSQCHNNEKGINTNIRCDKNHHWIQVKTISDVVEALIGAFIVDSGFKGATAFLYWLGIQVDFSPRQVDAICLASQAFLPLADKIDLNALENILKYKFLNKGLLIQAFVHPSYDNPGGCYQRLEYLGDSVLDYLITSYLYSKYPKLKPGHLSDLRSAAVSNISFADVARKWSFENFIICDSILREAVARYVNSVKSSGTKQGGNEERNCPKALGDIVESCIGALLLDTGFDLDQIWKTVLFLLDPVISPSKLQSNPLRDLYELCQSNNWEMNFSTTEKDGKLFMVTAKVCGDNVSAKASTTNASAKFGRKIVSREIFEELKAQGYRCRTPSLEEVLKETVKQEAKLIGYDETPYRESDGLQAPETSQSARNKVTHSDTSTENPSGNVKHQQNGVARSCVAGLARKNGNNRKSASKLYNKSVDSQGTGASNAVSAKSLLHELCAVNLWKPPLFECCNELGPSHLREYSFKVTMDTEEIPYGVIECLGQFRPRKKDAAESAAQGALWYLKTRGYISDNKKIQK